MKHVLRLRSPKSRDDPGSAGQQKPRKDSKGTTVSDPQTNLSSPGTPVQNLSTALTKSHTINGRSASCQPLISSPPPFDLSIQPSFCAAANHAISQNKPQDGQSTERNDGPAQAKDATKKDYWQLAVKMLQEEDTSMSGKIAGLQQAAMVAGDEDFAKQLLQATEQSKQALTAKRWKIGREVILRDQLDRLLKVVSSFITVTGSIDPIHAGLPLAGFCILMQTATNDSDQYAAMVAGVEEVVTIISRYKQIEALYLSRPQTTLKETFEARLISLYKHIIRYQISATCYYERNTMVRFLRSIPKLDDLSEVMATIQREDAACSKIGQVFDSQDALERHQELIKKLNLFEQRLITPSDQAGSGNVHWTPTRSTNTFFTGRENLLNEIESIVRSAVTDIARQDQCRIVITGIGGQGKSEICLQVANRVRKLFWGVFWVDVSTASLAEDGFWDIASRLNASVQTLEDARQGLTNTKHSWLLVLDNADNPEVDYQNYIPAGQSGVVILTSRNAECHRYATEKCVALDGLAEAEARELLLKAARIPPDQHHMFEDDAKNVSALLKSHPLALIQAGSYMSRGHCTMSDYPQIYQRQRKRLLKFRPAQAQSRYRDVYATFEASADILQSSANEAAKDALQLLPILATLGPSRLPLSLFEAAWHGAQTIRRNADDDGNVDYLVAWHGSRVLPLVQADDDAWDSYRLIEAINLLKAFALVSVDTISGFMSVSMHSLTHAWAKDRQDQKQQDQSWLITGCTMAISSKQDSFWQKTRQQLRPHLQVLMLPKVSMMFACGPQLMIVRLLITCGWLLHDLRDDGRLFTFLQNLFTHLNLDQKSVQEKWLPLYDLAGRNLGNFGKTRQAVLLQEQVVKIKEQTLAEDHPSRLASQHELARSYQANGQIKEAVLLLSIGAGNPSWNLE